MSLLQRIDKSAGYILNHSQTTPLAGIILGSGLGSFSREIEQYIELPYASIPHFPVSGVAGHSGSLILGTLGNIPVVVMQGRVHFYEGYSVEDICFPIRVLKKLGIKTLFLTNAAGGMNPDFEIGDIMIIRDHINLLPNPLIGNNIEELGPRFPDMSRAYDPELIMMAEKIADDLDIKIQKGIYVGVSGPSYETPAEYNAFRILGGDAVGMSTVPEVIAARHMDLKCFALSIITDLGIPGKIEYLTHEMVRKAAGKAEPIMAKLLKELIMSTQG